MNVVTWIVEQVEHDTGNVKRQAFTSYDEALDVYNNLKRENAQNFVSIEKSEKKLLLED